MGRLARAARRIERFLAPRARTVVRRIRRDLRASVDLAQTHVLNKRHWAAADALSANAAYSASVRKTIRERARYEVLNSPFAGGIVRTLANDLIGRGPALQLETDDTDLNAVLEAHWRDWSRAVRLAAKLRTATRAWVIDGEALALLANNGALDLPARIDLRLIECDRLTTPNYTGAVQPEDKAVDGIVFDEFGNPKLYHILKKHPGAADAVGMFAEYDRVPAGSVIHWFTAERPEQRRGVSQLVSSIGLFAQLRRFVLATLTSAEIAADLSVIMKTTAPPNGEAAEVDPWVTMDMERGAAMFAPEGWEPTQLKSEHPNDVFAPFLRSMVTAGGRPLSMPYNIAACDSSDYNYASGRLDHQTYYKAIDTERSVVESVVLDPLLGAWRYELLRNPHLGLFAQLERVRWPHSWIWPGHEHVDPAKEATAQERRLKNGTTTLADEYARLGHDWEDRLKQIGREIEVREKLGIPQPWEKTNQPQGAP